MNISHIRFTFFNLKILGEIVTPAQKKYKLQILLKWVRSWEPNIYNTQSWN